MPLDREIHLGYVGADAVWNFSNRIGADIVSNQGKTTKLVSKDEFQKTSSRIELAQAVYDKYNPILQQAYINTILAMGWKIVPPEKVKNPRGVHYDRHIYVDTTWGLREASIWGMHIHFDPDEVGDGPEEVTIGVNLSARYFPTILDMHDTFGTMGSVIHLDQALMDQIAICKRELIKVMPEFHDAEVYIKEIFY